MNDPTPRDPLACLRDRFRRGEKTRLLAFGSSNTERFLPGVHWLDVVELALRDTYGRVHQCINAGVCGHTALDLLARFEEDAAPVRPHVAIVTIGGNDSNPARGLAPEAFAGHLLELHHRFRALDCAVVFQTYYAPDPARVEHLPVFGAFMDAVRAVAQQTGSGLIDHLVRWEAFRAAHYDRYLALMQDGFHVNPRGNTVLGLYAARAFAAQPASDPNGFWDDAAAIIRRMDELTHTGV